MEARSRCGGRILTERPPGWPRAVELGAEFVHGGNAALARALRRASVQVEPVEERHWLVRAGRRTPCDDAWERIDATMRRIGPRFRGSFGDWLRKNRGRLSDDDRVLAETFVQGFQGAPLRRMSARVLYRAAGENDEQGRPVGGYERMVDAFAAELAKAKVELRLNSEVTRIDWTRGGATVRTGSETWRARAVVVTVPLGVLQRGAIRFAPKLAAKEALWRSLESGQALRVVLRLRADVWQRGPLPAELRARRGRAFGFLHSDEALFPVWWSLAPSPVLVGWTGGPAVKRMAGWAPERVFGAAKRTLARLLGCDEAMLGKMIVDWRTHDWAADRFTCGAYSFAAAGRETVHRRLAQAVGGTLFFAGEATADALDLGTVHGALASGERAAAEILARVKRGR